MADNNPEDIDQIIRLNELKEELREVSGQEPAAWTSPDCPPDVEEEFYRNMLAWERGPFVTQFDQLTRDGFDFPEAARLADAQLSAKLTELIARLTIMRVFLYHTDHLSDRGLYDWLRERGLRDEVPDMPVNPDACWHLDILGSYGDAEVDAFNQFYATEEQRREHARDYPDWPLPVHEDPKYDRDGSLPKSEH